ncbi:MAG: type II toxin-antitoxin system death-on-curing family toxin [bacterium]|nr:type II toxin-antitoxin system death-on-curing family toxin [bacterium]MDZ4343041.1 type II toxin-antitoxin system death-on-curing family toxin [Candidatus Binatia bacterium]
MYYLSIQEVEYVAHQLARELMRWNEPIPSFNTRFPGVLEQCLAVPTARYDKKSLYPGLVAQASMLLYVMIKNHPFQNGNKRVAIMTLFYFLYKNGKWLRIDNQELYNFATWVAASNPKVKDQTVDAIKTIMRQNLIKRDDL